MPMRALPTSPTSSASLTIVRSYTCMPADFKPLASSIHWLRCCSISLGSADMMSLPVEVVGFRSVNAKLIRKHRIGRLQRIFVLHVHVDEPFYGDAYRSPVDVGIGCYRAPEYWCSETVDDLNITWVRVDMPILGSHHSLPRTATVA